MSTLSFLLDLVFPPRCTYCAAYLPRNGALCAECSRRIVKHAVTFCGKCRARRYLPDGICHRDFPFLFGAAGEYADPILQSLIRSLKFGFVRAAAEPLGILLARYAARTRFLPRRGLLVPIPLGLRRLRERGYNQAELIARAFARRTGTPLAADLLQRTRHTRPQSGLPNGPGRAANIAGAFAVPAARASACTGRDVILIDDVVTSGATALETALTLRRAGARRIFVLACAKAS